MEYIDAPQLSASMTGDEMTQRGIFGEMGGMLRNMHAFTAEGYGPFRNGRGRYGTFREWLASRRERISYVKEKQFLTGKHGSIDGACDTLEQYAAGQQSVYCHYDFSTDHVFDTKPLTVFDPEPSALPPLLDVARSILMIGRTNVSVDLDRAADQFIDGYAGSGHAFDQEAFRAAILLQAYIKFRFWDQTNRQESIDRVRNYLETM